MLQNWVSKSEIFFSEQPHLDQSKNSEIEDLDEDPVDWRGTSSGRN